MRVTGFLIEKDGSAASADRETVQRLLDKGELLWFDLYRPDADELGMLASVFGIHHLAIDDAEKFGQRPKLEDYDDFTQLVAYGVKEGSDDLVEVHFFYSTRYLVTVRHGGLEQLPQPAAEYQRVSGEWEEILDRYARFMGAR